MKRIAILGFALESNAFAAALIAIGAAELVPGNWYIVAGGIGGSFVGALVETRRARRAA